MEETTRVLQLRREIHRLRTSPSLRLGAHVTTAIRRPWRAPFLIFSLPLLMLKIGFELVGWAPQPRSLQTNVNGRPLVKGNCVVMFPTNGVGFGHFTRMLALAKRMKKQDPNLEIIFFTTMPTLHLLKPYGIPAHHISGPKYFKGMDSEEWNMLLEEELNLCFEIHKPSMFIFDGAFPYRGMLRSIEGRDSLKKLWMRRGMFRKGARIPIDSIQFFDTIIHPGDGVDETIEEINHGLEILRSPPIIMLDESELLPRQTARYRLGIPLDCKAIYVQLGAGQINDISSEIRITLDELLKYENLHVVLGESMIGLRIELELPNIHIIRDFPNSQYFKGFDAVIQAGGYNSFHETRVFGLPALFYPNMETGMDDQLSRCLVAEQEGWGYVVQDRTKKHIQQGIEKLLNHSTESKHQQHPNGADDLSKKLVPSLGVAD
jgi:UDP-N-acetylglucosamine--N-acetylmuramyl-(pentapeptide) pyrophosphoryl-undecaprenol N-acetylglucosamine transferase